MTFPSAFLEELKSRTSLSEIAGRKLVWDKTKSQPGKGEYWACCPFHHEKTASLHIKDREGYYYCFGCHEKGDAIKFVRETENVSFTEAVDIIANAVGLTVPARDPAAAERAQKRDSLTELTEAAVRFYRRALNGAEAREARDYLEQRGLDSATLDQFEIGYAPSGRTGVFDTLIQAGAPKDKIIEAGLAADDGRGGSYDRFRGRIMFPIRDAQGRCIAFGGRSLDPTARAKYLNSPETPLFSKRRTLYNHGPARGETGSLVVAEGYMDVIALAQAGFRAVAPLGTAVTEDHLALLWRMADEPVLALDGDAAGRRAADRTAELALPALQPGKSVRFAFLPDGTDPDDLIRAQGPQAMTGLLESAESLVDALWRRETEGGDFSTPERKAALKTRLRALSASVANPDIREYYDKALRGKLGGLLRQEFQTQNRTENTGAGWRKPHAMAFGVRLTDGLKSETRTSQAATGTPSPSALWEAQILACALQNPQAAERCADHLGELTLESANLDSIRSALVWTLSDCADQDASLDDVELQRRVAAHCGDHALTALFETARRRGPLDPDGLGDAVVMLTAERAMEEAKAALTMPTDTEEVEQELIFNRWLAAKQAYAVARLKALAPKSA